MNYEGEGIDDIAVQHKVELHEIARLISGEFVIERGKALRARFQCIEKVVDYLVEREPVVKLRAVGVDVFHILEYAAPILTEIHYSADIFRRGNDDGVDYRLERRFDLVGARIIGRIVNGDGLTGALLDFIDNARRSRYDVEIKLSFKPLLDYLHMEKSEKSAAESEAERDTRFRLEHKRGVVQTELFERVLGFVVFRTVGGIDSGVNHRENGLEAGKRLGGTVVREGHGVADFCFGDAFYRSRDIADIARRKHVEGFESAERVEHSDLGRFEFRTGRHERYTVSGADGSFLDADVNDNSEIAVVDGVEDERAQRRVRVARRRRDIADYRVHDIGDVQSGLCGHRRASLGGNPDHVLDLGSRAVNIR